jgi:hypothetical protein
MGRTSLFACPSRTKAFIGGLSRSDIYQAAEACGQMQNPNAFPEWDRVPGRCVQRRQPPSVPQCGPTASTFPGVDNNVCASPTPRMSGKSFHISEPPRGDSADLAKARNALDETVSRRVNWLIHVSFHSAHFPERRTWLWHPHSHCCTRARRSHRYSLHCAVNTCRRRKSSTWSTRV